MTEQKTTRPLFKVSGTATIKHLNVRKEGPEDDKILAIDVKLEIKSVDRRLCAYFDEALEAFLWRGNTNALIARNEFLSPLTYFNEISSANVTIGMHSFHGCDVKKFQLHPQDGGVMTLTCSVALYPNSGDVAELAKFVQDEVVVSIDGPPDLFAGEPDQKVDANGNAMVDTAMGDQCEADPLYDEAVATVRKSKNPSISLVQRHLKIGYNRAARLLEDMERAGIVSRMQADGSRKLVGAAA